ncbi:MAG TPA: hypothetical protein VHG30_07100, partial [Microvirga sp.]|nr:hypothetical protein [Microvirga sp.]
GPPNGYRTGNLLFEWRVQPMMSILRAILYHLPQMVSWRSAPLVCRPRHLLVVALISTSADPALAGWNATPETIEQHPTWIYTPSTAMPNGKHPLLVVLHGCAQTHTELKEFGNLVPAAEASGTVVAVPFVGDEFFGTLQQRCWEYDRANDAKGHIVELVTLANTLKARSALNICTGPGSLDTRSAGRRAPISGR